mmetsp:Transcript_10767/g.24595  ORF Transcript_10767/g.24595 Transcript_10767/m.24595 type:complete len:83 (+) Transcript_10767:477-725(+)
MVYRRSLVADMIQCPATIAYASMNHENPLVDQAGKGKVAQGSVDRREHSATELLPEPLHAMVVESDGTHGLVLVHVLMVAAY